MLSGFMFFRGVFGFGVWDVRLGGLGVVVWVREMVIGNFVFRVLVSCWFFRSVFRYYLFFSGVFLGLVWFFVL